MSANGSDGRQGKRWVAICILAAVVISCAGWFRLKMDSSLEPLLPENSAARQTILFLRDSSFADKAVLWFRLREVRAGDRSVCGRGCHGKKAGPAAHQKRYSSTGGSEHAG